MTPEDAVLNFIEKSGLCTKGEDLFAYRAPQSTENKNSRIWLLTPEGSSKIHTAVTGQDTRMYLFTVSYRSDNTQDLQRKMFEFSKYVTRAKCIHLDGFYTVQIELVESGGEAYLDTEQRWVREAVIQATIYDITTERPESQ